MEYLNKVLLRGVVGNAKIQSVGNTAVCRFSVATETSYQSRSGDLVVDVTWTSCSVWQRTGLPSLEEIQKGALIELEGRLRCVSYTNPEGEDRKFYEVLVNSFKILPREENE